MKRTLRGIIAAIPTPVDASLSPDLARYVTLARHLLDTGCDGLNLLGTTGEATSLSVDQRLTVMQHVAGSNLPMDRLMVGTGAAAGSDAAILTAAAADLGFAGALVLPPFYYKDIKDEGILRYFDTIVTATEANEIPLYLYNFPALSFVKYTPELVTLLVERFGARIAGLKDSSNDLPYARQIAGLAGELDVFPANVAALKETRTGVFAGSISASANIDAGVCARALHDADDAAFDTAVAIRTLFSTMPTVPAVKALLAHRLKDPSLADTLPPYTRLHETTQRDLAARFDALMEQRS